MLKSFLKFDKTSGFPADYSTHVVPYKELKKGKRHQLLVYLQRAVTELTHQQLLGHIALFQHSNTDTVQ